MSGFKNTSVKCINEKADLVDVPEEIHIALTGNLVLSEILGFGPEIYLTYAFCNDQPLPSDGMTFQTQKLSISHGLLVNCIWL